MNFNKNQFPTILPRVLEQLKIGDKPIQQIKGCSELKDWYKTTFQKGNRWNRTSIRSITKNYASREVLYLKICFELLFDQSRNYNKAFVKYMDEILLEHKQKTGKRTFQVWIEQQEYLDLIHYIGELKRKGKIRGTYKELARFIHTSFLPDDPLQTATIVDRLKNHKGYK